MFSFLGWLCTGWIWEKFSKPLLEVCSLCVCVTLCGLGDMITNRFPISESVESVNKSPGPTRVYRHRSVVNAFVLNDSHLVIAVNTFVAPQSY